MTIWAWAPGTVTTCRVAAMGGGGGGLGVGALPAGMPPNRRATWACTSAAFT